MNQVCVEMLNNINHGVIIKLEYVASHKRIVLNCHYYTINWSIHILFKYANIILIIY